MRRPAWRDLLAFAALAALPCSSLHAHSGGTIGFATVSVTGPEVRYELALGLPAVPEALAQRWQLRQAEVTPDYAALRDAVVGHLQVSAPEGRCAAVPSPTPVLKGANVAVVARFRCPAVPRELRIRDDLADLFGADYHTLANVGWPGGSAQFMFQPDRREARVALRSAGPQGWSSFFTLGIEHILIGFDHLLFLLALILRGGNAWSLLKIITAFTIAHSITLALAAFNVIVLPARLVEGAIALSIAYVAAENLFAKHAVLHRWVVSFAFGLVHGIGFSSVLREMGLPQDGLFWALLGFNLGVEAGQALAVLAALPLLLYVRRTRFEKQTTVAVSVLVLVVGLALFVERALIGAT